MSQTPLLLGAVAYDPKVVTIWDGFQRYFVERGLPFDYILYTNYERQVEALLSGHIHVAWNSPLAWLEAERLASARGRHAEAICMRDSDRDLTSIVIARNDDPVRTIADLRGRRVAVGAKDSPQATLIPLYFLAQQGLEPNRDFEVVEFDALRGKHGDHIGGERDAARALLRGECDAACLIDGNHLLFIQDGTLPPGATRTIAQTPRYDHCNFTVLDGAPANLIARFRELLLEMSGADPEVRRLFDLEGLKSWVPGRREGYAVLSNAVEKFGYP
ncbi:MAG: phosphate/phosphite/phosphonate ABC transporter substrate-binding protein, partial [Acidobacteria bacterium]|nr:phosphate/phosphite/phosphonate ABC transporter substrate-binding protein [Acidobacteriota bacterium]